MFVTFEGIDGSGKSTQLRLLADHLQAKGHEVIVTREPGGSKGAEDIRRLLVEGDPGRWSAETEILLFTAARRDHVERLIQPGLAAGAIVVSDRFADSTRVYQGATRGDLRATVDALHARMIAMEPELTLVIDMDPDAALARGLARQSGEDRFEDFGAAFQRKLRDGFLALTEEYPARVRLVDGSRDREAVAADVAAIVDAALAAGPS